jgi:hypothetical protein
MVKSLSPAEGEKTAELLNGLIMKSQTLLAEPSCE